MDLDVLITELKSERQALDSLIASVERLADQRERRKRLTLRDSAAPRRRGRHSMGAEERRAVAARMRTYWQKRKAQQAAKN